jgi:hypothetical protein
MSNKLLIIGVTEDGFSIFKRSQFDRRAAIAFLNFYEDRLRALLDKPILICVTWDDGDSAVAINVSTTDHTPFENFTLPFPAKATRH